MTEYIYIVKCDGCEDEMFNFFTDARMQCDLVMSKHPIITQIEVERNDFGECTNSCDLGTVWSWEEAMKDTCTDAEPAKCIFTKDDLKDYVPEEDSEFDALDNSVDFEVSETADVSTDNAKKCKSLKRASYLKEGSYVTLSETDQLTRESLYDQLVNKKAVIEIDIGDHYNPEICFDDGGCYSNSVLAVSYTVDGLFEIDMWHYSDDGEVTDDLDYEFSTNSFEDCLEELTSFMPDLLVEWRKRAVPEGMTIEQLVEEMEEHEDTVECTVCEELFDKSECSYINVVVVVSHNGIVFFVGELGGLTLANDYNVFVGEGNYNVISEGVAAFCAENEASVLLVVKLESLIEVCYLYSLVKDVLVHDLAKIIKCVNVFQKKLVFHIYPP